ncbi:MAG: hydroxypyruvate isomerase family protein [Granulosicoccus sp.]
MPAFSANLGFLFTEYALPDAIRAAADAGFEAVECHWPFETPAHSVNAALVETGLPMLGLNTRRGNVEAGDNGLVALPGREAEAMAAIDEAIDYARAINCGAIHAMAGFASGEEAHRTFIQNLTYAIEKATPENITVLIEPLNRFAAPGYFLNTSEQARAIIEEIDSPTLKLMFDCYHLQIQEGDLTRRLQTLRSIIGHIQFASVPDRGAPDHGEICYPWLFNWLDANGFNQPLGAEFHPQGTLPEGAVKAWKTAAQRINT